MIKNKPVTNELDKLLEEKEAMDSLPKRIKNAELKIIATRAQRAQDLQRDVFAESLELKKLTLFEGTPFIPCRVCSKQLPIVSTKHFIDDSGIEKYVLEVVCDSCSAKLVVRNPENLKLAKVVTYAIVPIGFSVFKQIVRGGQ